MTRLAILSCICGVAQVLAQDATSDSLLRRSYQEGAELEYLMTGRNGGSSYEVGMRATTKRSADGRFFEEYAWFDLVSNGKPRALPAQSKAFRVTVTLEPGAGPFSPPDLSKAPMLIGPVLDLLTFYADLFLAIHAGSLQEAGDHSYVPSPNVGSWADGTSVVIGEDAVDFDISLAEVDAVKRVARVIVKHLPPEQPKIQLPAEWMREPVADSANNWVQVRRKAEMFVAAVGKETFDVELTVSLVDGRILSATMENPVETIARECRDAALADCDEPRSERIIRRIGMTLVE